MKDWSRERGWVIANLSPCLEIKQLKTLTLLMEPGTSHILLLHTHNKCAKDISEEDRGTLPSEKWFQGLGAKVPIPE